MVYISIQPFTEHIHTQWTILKWTDRKKKQNKTYQMVWNKWTNSMRPIFNWNLKEKCYNVEKMKMVRSNRNDPKIDAYE